MRFYVKFEDNSKLNVAQWDVLGKAIYDLIQLCEEIDQNSTPKYKNIWQHRETKKRKSKCFTNNSKWKISKKIKK